MSAPSRRDLVRYMIDKGLSERRALRVIGMSPSAYRYQCRMTQFSFYQASKVGMSVTPHGR